MQSDGGWFVVSVAAALRQTPAELFRVPAPCALLIKRRTISKVTPRSRDLPAATFDATVTSAFNQRLVSP